MWKRRNRFFVGKIVVVVILLIIALRLILAEVALNKLNGFLADFSPDYSAHVSNLSLSFLRGAYRFEGAEAKLKQGSKKNFMNFDYVDVSLAWRDLIQLRFRTDISISGLHFEASEDVIKALTSSKSAKKDTEELGETLFPVEISHIDIQNSSVHLSDGVGLPPELAVRLTQIQGRLSNATPSPERPISLMNLKATIQEHATFYIVGETDASRVPTEWVLSAEVKQLKLASLNPFLLRTIPLTFNKGILDAYAEFKGDKGAVEGYVKPFIKDLEVTGDQKDWKGFRHAGIEIVSGAAKYLLRSGADHSLATHVDLKYENKKLDYSLAKILGGAIEHGYKAQLEPGIENKYQLSYKQKGRVE